MPANYPNWNDEKTPNTHSKANVTRMRKVSKVPAIRVHGATYRGSRPLFGVFELVSVTPQQVSGEERYEVYCAWFGVTPLTTYPRISVRPGDYELLSNYTGEVIDNISYQPSAPPVYVPLPDEVNEPDKLYEGAVRTVIVNAYERNPEARRRCIEAHGTSCCICGFSFGAVYGPEAEGYVHIHHIQPLSEIGREYIVDPVEDLRPVCPNCHAMLHLGGRCRTLDEVQRLLVSQSA